MQTHKAGPSCSTSVARLGIDTIQVSNTHSLTFLLPIAYDLGDGLTARKHLDSAAAALPDILRDLTRQTFRVTKRERGLGAYFNGPVESRVLHCTLTMILLTAYARL